jgi:dihydrofolate synthase/folylpolyglutamate synthase
MSRVSRERKAGLYRLYPREYEFNAPRGTLDFTSNGLRLKKVKPGLKGPHQLTNAALVLKAISLLRSECGVKITKSAVRQGLASTDWPGRFQIMERPGEPIVVLDVCHNVGSVKAFIDSLRACFPSRKVRLVVGFVKRKPHQEMFDLLSSVASAYYLVPLKSHRTIDMKQVMTELDFRGIPFRYCGSLDTARRRLSKEAQPDDITGVIGSHFLVGEYLSKYGTA